jgi:hypothetical protein
MKMTSKGTLLVAVAGVIGLGCSAPADDNATMKPAPAGFPPYVTEQQTPATNTNVNPLQPAGPPINEVTPAPVVQQPMATGMGGAGGAGAMPAPGSTIPVGPLGTGFALTPVAGWVAGGTNEAGIQGSFFTLSDATGTPPGSTTTMPADFTMATGPTSICLSGTASQVMMNATTAMPDYARYWGGGIGFNLGDPGGTAGPGPWMRGKVVGVSFTVTGTGVPPTGQFRFGANFYNGATINRDACVNITTGANTIRFDQVVDKCYQAGGAPIPATAPLESLKWQVTTVTTAPTPYNFCVTNLTAIVQ